MTSSTVLVTGGCGYIGSHVARQLSERGDRVVVLDDLSTGFRDALITGERLYVGRIGDAALLERLFAEEAIDAVAHLAASIVVPDSVADPIAYYDNNTAGTIQLLKACTAAGVQRLVFSSTAAVYGDQPGEPIAETAPTRPASPYGRSKLMDEWILRDLAAASPLRSVVLRYFNVAGADLRGRIGQRFPNATHLIKVACETALGKRARLTVFGDDYPTRDGTCIRDYIHVEDLAAAHLKALDYLQAGGASTTLNCGYGRGSTVREVIEAVEAAAERALPVVTAARRPGDVGEVVADASAIRRVLGWQPRYDDLGLIVASALRWEKKLDARMSDRGRPSVALG
jgi:UDP-glucose 4-epimerase